MIQNTSDSPIDEIHRIRREISDRFGGDIVAIAEDAARRQAASNRPVWQPKHDEQSDAREPVER
ncbi:MAG: hypothetical protein J5I93_13695 [Pirellulaceae bacterium]|nr:hypothetical protein [Pirellulaceae bacterium]